MRSYIHRYIALFHFFTDSDGSEQIGITFPDFDGCVSQASDMEEAYRNAAEILALHIYGMEEDGDVLPEPTNIKDIPQMPDTLPTLIEADTLEIQKHFEPPVNVERTFSVPKWLCIEADRLGFDISAILQDALREKIGAYK